jgi:hypothetical protein
MQQLLKVESESQFHQGQTFNSRQDLVKSFTSCYVMYSMLCLFIALVNYGTSLTDKRSALCSDPSDTGPVATGVCTMTQLSEVGTRSAGPQLSKIW